MRPTRITDDVDAEPHMASQNGQVRRWMVVESYWTLALNGGT